MGLKPQFICEKCGYSVFVSGGVDQGMAATVETMVCRNCRELVDVLIEWRGEEGPTSDSDCNEDMGICPNCRSKKDLSPWTAPGLCPKCGGQMIESGPIMCWD